MSQWPLMFQPLAKYAVFEGRSRRSEFWLWVLFRFLLNAALGSIASSFLFSHMLVMNSQPDIFISRYMTYTPLFSLISLGLLIPSIAVGVRRLHDSNRTGWWLVAPYVAALLGIIAFFILFGAQLFQLISAHHDMSDTESFAFFLRLFGTLVLCFLPALICDIVLLVFFVLDGTPGPNRFGPDPKGRGINGQATAEVF